MALTIQSNINSLFSSITYSVGSVVIDPGDSKNFTSNIKAVLLTHAHFDHIYGLNDLIGVNPNVKVYTNAIGKEMLLNAKKNLSFYHETPFVFNNPKAIIIVDDGSDVQIDDLIVKAIFTPGHNPSCITWVIGDCVFSGDSFIPGVKTVTNLPKSDKKQAEKSEELIMKLAQGCQLYPGHKV